MALSLQRYIGYNNCEFVRILRERAKREQERFSDVVTTITVGDVLPESLIIEILSWLPVKAVLQFKCVCKSWYAIIASPQFISKHLENYYNNNDDMDCCLTVKNITNFEVGLWGNLSDESLDIVVSQSLHEAPMHSSEICGPCNGIYYMYLSYRQERALWNPTIDELNILPPIITKPNLPANLRCDGYETFGVGLDPLMKDYKVVVIRRYDVDNEIENYEAISRHPPSVVVYSLRTDSWKYWGDLPRYYDIVDNNESYIFVNGSFYWIARSWNGEFEEIISFNIVDDSLKEIQVPNYEKPASRSLGIYHDSVAFYTIRPPRADEKCFDIWAFNEGQSWTKKITIEFLEGIMSPLGHFKNDKAVLLCDDGSLVLCDPDTEEFWDLADGEGWIPYTRGVFVYMESLVSTKALSRQAACHEEVETGTNAK